MVKRGKAMGWTPAQDTLVFNGGSVEGRTAQQNCDRRYKLRKCYAAYTRRGATELLTRIGVLQGVKRAPKACTKAFLERLRAVAAELEK